ncbi:CPBP family intramembrane glutamic endopeptidase, BDIM_20840 family [Luteimonas kalidii]|uniref:CPBP family intramembrane metalloprotease n=1 Tax=Luteimonas kalidii TaxID=3042025 RepID=A0ABT6JSH8_9GAMM|nr:CPBP family intramembrane metalloprotease [Luteimonas kalidii]MDH5833643.1 CPBP family intramembrane metalloprotease [Luteimonas kalidii]
MSDALIEIALHMAVVLALALVAAVATRSRMHPGWLAVALGLMLLRDALVLRGYGLVPELVTGSDWNWTGKVLATAGLLAVAALPWFGMRRCGVTLRQAPGSAAAWWVFCGVAALIIVLAVVGRDGADDLETIAFQWTMPGIEEELFYRGVLLLALNRALDGGDDPPRLAGIGWGGVLASVAFGLGHALPWRDGAPAFDVMAFALTGGPALLIAWFRARTRSLVLPVLAHNTANGVSTLF